MNPTTPRPCAPRARCGRYRTCPTCARIRQAKIADAAERLQRHARDLTWTTIIPDDREWRTLIRCRSAFLEAEQPPGAIWTVEAGQQTGLPHCNILHPTTRPRQLRHAAVWQAPITTTARAVAAYISKQAGFPAPDAYAGRLYGTAGPLWQWLATGKGFPVIEAAKTQYDLDPAPLTQSAPMTGADYRAIAARRIPDILRAAPLYGRSRRPA